MICIRTYNPGTCSVGPGSLISIIEDENRLDEIEALVEQYNSGLGKYGTHYSAYIEDNTLINEIPTDLLNPKCKCLVSIEIGHTRIDSCPIHGNILETINELRYEDPLKFDCKQLIKQDKMIDAIKLYRMYHQEIGLYDAKMLMMSWED